MKTIVKKQICEEVVTLIKQKKKINSEILLRIWILIGLCLTVILEGMYWLSMYRNIDTVNISGHVWYILMWGYRLFIITVVMKTKGKVNRAVLWCVFGYLMFSCLLSLVMAGEQLSEMLRQCKGYEIDKLHPSVKFSLQVCINRIITELLFCISYLFIVFKQSTRRITIIQGICWGLIVILNIILLFNNEMKMYRYSEPWIFYSHLQAFFSRLTSILFWWWIMLKKRHGLEIREEIY